MYLSRIVVTGDIPGDLVRELVILYRGALYLNVATRDAPERLRDSLKILAIAAS